MRAYADLTERGKIRRLHGIARAALESYDLEISHLRCIARDTNTTFRVDTTGGEVFALRVQSDDLETDAHTATEVAWLEALGRSGLPVVRVIPTRDGSPSVVVATPEVPGPRTCVLFSWVGGRTLGGTATAADYLRLGVLSAQLHDHGQRWKMPAGLPVLVWDRIFYYPSEPVVLYEARFERHMTPHRTRVVREVEKRAEAELARIHRESPVHLVHGDLHPWNVHTIRGRLIALDFDDVMLAAPVQDVAITLFYNREQPQYSELRTAFEAGYRTVRAWPVEWDGQLELLMAARTVNFINYVLRMDLDLDDHMPRMTGRIEQVLEGPGR